jgi:hypothetical protein
VFAPTVVQTKPPHVERLSKKIICAASLIGALLLASITVNALIIFATAGGA